MNTPRAGAGDKQHGRQLFGILTSDVLVRAKLILRALVLPKMKSSRFLDFYLLNGGPEEPGLTRRGIYRKGENLMIDNLMMSKSEIWSDWVTPGR